MLYFIPFILLLSDGTAKNDLVEVKVPHPVSNYQ